MGAKQEWGQTVTESIERAIFHFLSIPLDTIYTWREKSAAQMAVGKADTEQICPRAVRDAKPALRLGQKSFYTCVLGGGWSLRQQTC